MSGDVSASGLRVCFVDSFHGRSEKPIPKQSELVAQHLESAGAVVLKTSAVRNPLLRVFDIAVFVVRRRHAYDVICVQSYRRSFGVTVLATALGRMLRKRVVVVLRGGKIPELAGRRPRLVRWAFDRADAIVAPSGYLHEAIGSLGYESEIVPNAVETGQYRFRHRTSAAPCILWIRSFYEIYNPWLALRTFRKVRDVHPDATLTMAGPDIGALESCRQLSAELGVDDGVDFIGYLRKEEIGAVGARHDVFLNTSNMDNVPVTVLEALAGGLCVVSTDVDGMPYLLEDGRDGLLVSPDDPDAMARAVLRVLDDDALAGRLSLNGRRKVEGFDVAALVPRWSGVLEGRMEPAPSPSASRDYTAVE